MDFGQLVFAAIVSVPLFYGIYALFHTLKRHWREALSKEEAWEKDRLEQEIERLTDRAEAQELALEDSRRKLEPVVEDLDRASGEYDRRLENLEAVVVGEVGSPLPIRPHEVSDPSTDESSGLTRSTKKLNRRRTSKLAHRFGK